MTTNAKIRTAQPQDLEAVREVLVETWHATYDDLFGADVVAEITNRWHSVEALQTQLAAPGTVCLVAEFDDVIVATSLAREVKPSEINLSRIYVLPIAQGIGIGQALLNETLVRFMSASVVRLEVEPRNAAAIAFYEAQGFVRVGAVPNCGGESHPADVYELRF